MELLRDEKEQCEYKLKQNERLIKCQQNEIESKSSLIKQSELVRISTIFLLLFTTTIHFILLYFMTWTTNSEFNF